MIDMCAYPNAKKAAMPKHVKPELCNSINTPPRGSDWIHEIKWDGYRIIGMIGKDNDKDKGSNVAKRSVKLLTRNGLDWTDKFQVIANELNNIPVSNAILDGELVVLNQKGISQFQLLQNFLKGENDQVLIYYVFDVLFYNGYDLRKCALLDRKNILKEILQALGDKQKHIHFSDYVRGQGELVYKNACTLGLEGIVSKDIHSPYEHRRSRSWLKFKCIQRQEFVIGGFTKPKGSRSGFGSLLVGFYNKKQNLVYCGHVGTGFDRDTLNSLFKQLESMIQKKNPFYGLADRSITAKATWVKPLLVAELEFTEWTEDNILRQPSFLGLRLDKPAKTVRTEKMLKKENRPLDSELIISDVKLTHPNNIIEVTKTLSKLELANYYQKVSAWILPHIIDRPLSLLRCPSKKDKESILKSQKKQDNKNDQSDGEMGGTCFYQKHYTKAFPPGVYPILIKEPKNRPDLLINARKIPKLSSKIKPSKKTSEEIEQYLFIKTLHGLIALVQLNTLEIHPWGSKQKTPNHPDRMIFDLDPGPGLSWKDLIEAAFIIRHELNKISLQSFVKTTGGKGLHIVLPLRPKYSWEEVKNFAKTFSNYLAEKYPKQFTDSMVKTKRAGKVYIDYLRNTRGSTAVAPYSTRARAGAPISTPVSWTELKKIKSSEQFTVSNIYQRLEKLKKDPWQGFFDCQQTLPKV